MNKRLKETLSVRAYYSNISDEELDHVVRSIKIRMSHAGYRLMKGELLARGHRLQWHRMKASMQATSCLLLTHVLSLSSVKSIIYRLFKILKSNFIHHHFCCYNVCIYFPDCILQRKQSERLVIASFILIS